MNHVARIEALLSRADARRNIERTAMIEESVRNGEAMVSACGALGTWTPRESTGRSPKDTVIVRRAQSEDTIDWTSPNNNPIDEETFDMVMSDALGFLEASPRLYVTDRVLGADPAYALPVHTVADWALTALFTDNVFRPWDDETVSRSVFAEKPFRLVVAPYRKLDPKRYEGRLRIDPALRHTSTMLVGMDMDRRLGVVVGSAYGGSVKKLMFTVMNYLLPLAGVLPLHCSANEGEHGDCALLLGLSGTGKTALSADPTRSLLGDDEHGWSDNGIANFENGCYAKLIDLSATKEPEIYAACFHEADYRQHGAVIENAMLYPWGEFDLFDDRYTPNSRGSYPLSFLSNVKAGSCSGHPRTILFLTADANGVIPPVARLTREQAMLWFLMGYTSKLAGTETGITTPVTVFSRFFGEPFMPCNPDVYARMLGERMDRHGTSVYLINTGWTGGPYGTGHRIDLPLTRAMVNAALTGALDDVPYRDDAIFKIKVPTRCPGIEDANILTPELNWADAEAYRARALKLAGEFAAHFEKAYGDKGIAEEIARACPGR